MNVAGADDVLKQYAIIRCPSCDQPVHLNDIGLWPPLYMSHLNPDTVHELACEDCRLKRAEGWLDDLVAHHGWTKRWNAEKQTWAYRPPRGEITASLDIQPTEDD